MNKNIVVAYDEELARKTKEISDEYRKETLTLANMREFPEHNSCLICFRTIPKTAVVCSEECKEKLIEERRKNIKLRELREKETKERNKKIRWEVEHNLRKRLYISQIMVRGLKKDWERFVKNLPKIMKEYNLDCGK